MLGKMIMRVCKLLSTNLLEPICFFSTLLFNSCPFQCQLLVSMMTSRATRKYTTTSMALKNASFTPNQRLEKITLPVDGSIEPT